MEEEQDMKTKFNVGEKVYFKATINRIEVYPNGKIAYKIKEWPDFLFMEGDLIENSDPLQHIADALERIEGKMPEANSAHIPIAIGNNLVETISMNRPETADLVDELEMREGVSSIIIGPSNKTDIKVDGPAVVLIVAD